MTEDIRWEQRFSNFNKVLSKLSQAVSQAGKEELSELEVEGLIQRFEYLRIGLENTSGFDQAARLF